MVSRSGGRVVPNVQTGAVSSSTVSDNNINSTITRLTNSFQVNGISKKSSGVAPPVPPNKPTVSLYKPLAKLEGIVNSSDAAKWGCQTWAASMCVCMSMHEKTNYIPPALIINIYKNP